MTSSVHERGKRVMSSRGAELLTRACSPGGLVALDWPPVPDHPCELSPGAAEKLGTPNAPELFVRPLSCCQEEQIYSLWLCVSPVFSPSHLLVGQNVRAAQGGRQRLEREAACETHGSLPFPRLDKACVFLSQS